MNSDSLSESLLLKIWFLQLNCMCFYKICIVFNLAILSTWCSGELHLNHPAHLMYLIVHPVCPDAELLSIFHVIFKLLYDFLWLSRPLIRMLSSTEQGETFWKRSSLPAYLQVYPFTCSFSIQCDYLWNGICTVYVTSLSPLNFLSFKKTLKVVPSFFFSVIMKILPSESDVYQPCW